MQERFHIRLVEIADAEALGVIGPAIYAESYGHMWDDPRAYAKHLDSFGASAVATFIARQDARLWLVECERMPVGFLSIIMGSPDPIDGRTDGAEVPRIYILGPARGKGLGAKLLAEADRYAARSGAGHLWLDAMEAAPWAWQTYRKWGFAEIGCTTFPGRMKPEFKPMVVMRRDCVA